MFAPQTGFPAMQKLTMDYRQPTKILIEVVADCLSVR